ncbi:MAG: hypothetical protein HYY02_13285 [Chloroflexi bacterium]|nr:hypothetical protein [Chloroflexota bacterium]
MHRLAYLFFGSMLVVLVLLTPALRLHAANPTLSLSPASGAAGATVSASGTGFQAGETVRLRWGSQFGTVLAQPTADASGAFSNATFTVPEAAPGSYPVWAVGFTSDFYTTAEFTVTTGAGAPTPTPAATGTPAATATSTAVATATPTATPTGAPPPGVTIWPGGPLPSAGAPSALAVDPLQQRIYVVHRPVYGDLKVNADLLPTDRVSVVDASSRKVVTTVPVGKAINGVTQGIAVDPMRQRVYVTNEDDDTVSIINSRTNTVVTTTQVGRGPTGIAADPDQGLVYVANSSGKSVTILDAATGAVTGTVALSGGAYAVAVDRSTHLAYVTVQAAPWTIVAINGRTKSIEAQVPLNLRLSLSGIAVDPGSRLYAADYDTGTVTVIDIGSGGPREVSLFPAGLFPRGVAVDPATHLIYVTESGSNLVNIFDSAGSKLKSIEVLRLPSAIAVDEVARRVYVADTMSDSLSVLDAQRQTLVTTIPLGNADFGLAYDPATKRLYGANYPADAISVLDATNGSLVASWPSGAGPWAVAVDPEVRQVYSLNYDEGTLTVLNAVDGQVKGSVNVGKRAQGLAVSTVTHRVYVTGEQGLTVLDGMTNQVIATVAVGERPMGIAVDDDGRRVYVANLGSGTISVVDSDTHQVVATWQPQLANVWGLAIDPGPRRLYVTITPNTIGDFSGLMVLDAATGAFISQAFTGNRAALVAANPRTHQVFVTDSTDGTLTILDGATGAVVATLATGNGAHGLSVDPGTGLVFVGNASDGTIAVVDPTKIAVGPSATPTPATPVSPGPTTTPVTTPSPTPTASPAATPCGPAAAPVVGAPAPSAPAHCATLPAFETSFRWANPAGATQFELRVVPYASDGPGLDIISDVSGPSGAFSVLAPPDWYFLLPDMTYTWTVRTTSATVFITPEDPRWGPWSPAWVFRTPKASSAGITPLAPPDRSAVTTLTPTLQWQDSAPAAWYYEVQLSTDPAFETDPAKATAFVYWEMRHGGVTTPRNSYAVSPEYPLAPGATYYWRVRPRVQGDGVSVAWSPAWRFTTQTGAATPTPTRTATPAPTQTAAPAPTQTATPAPTQTPLPTPSSGETPAVFLGTWRVYSAQIYYDDGRRGPDNPARYGRLELQAGGVWQYGTSTGRWSVSPISAEDWNRWGVQPYGPTRKLALSGWGGGLADGPTEESAGVVDFLWVIYRAGPPTVSAPATIWLKFGRE